MVVKAGLAKILEFLYMGARRYAFATQAVGLVAKMRPTMLLPDPGKRLKPHYRKIRESLLFVMKAAHEKGFRPTQFDLVKSLFVADLWHMNTYGRPVTFDNHFAMVHGPVPSEAYDMLKPNYNWKTRFGEDAPFLMRPFPERGNKAFEFYELKRKADEDVLSKSDKKLLIEALEFVIELGFKRVRDWTHEIPAYKSAWENRGIKDAEPMDLAAMLDSKDEEDAEAIAFASHHLA